MKIDKNKLSLVDKFIALLNSVEDEASAIEDIVETDNTESGEVILFYQLNEDTKVTVDTEGFVRYEDATLVGEGEYKLLDGAVLVIDADGKFVETKESDISTETDEEVTSPEESQVAMETEVEELEPTTADDMVKEGEVEEVALEMEDFEIEGNTYNIPSEVVAYINKLIGERDTKDKELEVSMSEVVELKSQLPSVEPISKVNMGEEVSDAARFIQQLNRYNK